SRRHAPPIPYRPLPCALFAHPSACQHLRPVLCLSPPRDASPPSTRPHPCPSHFASAPTAKPCPRCGNPALRLRPSALRRPSRPAPASMHRCTLSTRQLYVHTASADHSVSVPIHVVRVYAVCLHAHFRIYPTAASAPCCRPVPTPASACPHFSAMAFKPRMRDGTRSTKLVSTARRGKCGRRAVTSGGVCSLSEPTWRPQARVSRSVPVPPCDDVRAKYEKLGFHLRTGRAWVSRIRELWSTCCSRSRMHGSSRGALQHTSWG
ncbi:hypothetical protein B0H14DRAFT_3587084, partial [Mycena olivaceomarginata]